MKTLRLFFFACGLALLSSTALAVIPTYFFSTNADGTLAITQYNGATGIISIPTNANGLTVTVIGSNAFASNSTVTNVTMDTNITVIGPSAFLGCFRMTNVVIPNSVTNIGDAAFSGADLQNVTVPGSVTTFGNGVFSNCLGLGQLTFNDGVLNIGDDTIHFGMSFTNVNIPGTVTNIGARAFFQCGGLTNVSLPLGLLSIGDQAFSSTGLHSITIPGTVTNMGASIFANLGGLNSVIINQGVTSIGDFDFQSTGVTSVVIPGSVTNIGFGAFDHCGGLQNLTIAPGLQVIGPNAFDFTGIHALTLPDTVTDIGASAFTVCPLTNVTLGNSVQTIGAFAFAQNVGPTTFIIPATVVNIGPMAFGNIFQLTAVFFGGDRPPLLDSTAFSGSNPNAIAYYFTGTLGWGAPIPGISTVAINPPWGALQVTVTGGGQWQVDGGSFQNSGAVVSNLSIGAHIVSFPPVNGLFAPADEQVTIIAAETTVTNGNYLAEADLTVTLEPTGAIAAGARWQVDGGASQTSGTTVNGLAVGNHTVSFTAGTGWTNPPNQIVSVAGSASENTTTAVGTFTPATEPSSGLILLTNGLGTIQHKSWPPKLVIGQAYTVTAVPKPGNLTLFENWVGGTNAPYFVLSTNASYTFTMQSNLVLEANFVTNIFLAAQGNYYGLFIGFGARTQTNSGAFNFAITPAGALTGKLFIGSEAVPLAGKVAVDGSAQIISTPHNGGSFTTMLQLDVPDQAVNGLVSNQNFIANLSGFQAVFNAKNKATGFAGRYTMIIPGTNDPTAGPYGASYGTVTVSPTGAITFAGNLADGTPVSQSTVISPGGLWPLYINLYGGQGSLWAWNIFSNGTVTALPSASWINATNSSKSANYRAGFTNQLASVTGGLYVSTNQPLLSLTNGEVLLVGNSPAFAITNDLALASNNKITFTTAEDTDKLTLSINKTTGIISGSFANPAHPKQMIKVNGALLQGETNAQGYFPGTNQGGGFMLVPK